MAKPANVDDVTWEERPVRFFGKKKRSLFYGTLVLVFVVGVGSVVFFDAKQPKPELEPAKPISVEAIFVPAPERRKKPLARNHWCQNLTQRAEDLDLLIGPAMRAYCRKNR